MSTLTPKGISTLRDKLQEAFNLTYDEAYAMAIALEHGKFCEEFRLDAGRFFVQNLNTAIDTIIK